jgi:hypothetical protein
MTLAQFVRANRSSIDSYVTLQYAGIVRLPLVDRNRRLWVLNDLTLYDWARNNGVDLL